jgi:hypothetical protein
MEKKEREREVGGGWRGRREIGSEEVDGEE